MAGLAHDKNQVTDADEREPRPVNGAASTPDGREHRVATDAEVERAADYVFRRYAALYKRLA